MQFKLKFKRLKRIYIIFFSISLFLIFFSTTFLHANTFKVTNIEISESFELNFDKNQVLDKGFKLAFLNLISMITTSSDKDKIKNVSIREIKGMIDSFKISKERFINDTYVANLDVIFSKRNTLRLLEIKNIFPSIPIINKILLVPIVIDLEKDSIFLFSDNQFYEDWNNRTENYHLLNYLLPSEDLEDLKEIQNNSDIIEDYDFKDLIKRYDIEDHIITIIFVKKKEIRVLSKINFNNSLKIDNKIFSNIDLKQKKEFDFVLDDLKNVYEDYWKKNNEINTSIKLPLTISINANEYSKTEKFETTLNKLDLVSDFYILRFNNKNVFYRIVYNGSPLKFIDDMKKADFNVATENKIWLIE